MTARGSVLYQIILIVLSIYVLAALIAESFFVEDPEIKRLLQYIDFGICLLFLSDFFINLIRAKDKVAFLRWGWIDLISSLPMIDPLRWGRLARVARILRVLRAIRSAKYLYRSLLSEKIKSLTLLVFIFVFFSYTVSAVIVLDFERTQPSEIDTAEKALWWSFLNLMNAKTSISSATTTEAALAAIYLNKVGLIIFAYLNAILIAWLMNRNEFDHAKVNSMSD